MPSRWTQTSYPSACLRQPRSEVERSQSMRLTLRLLTLAVLLTLAGFTNLVSPVSRASPCTDGCANGWRACNDHCYPNCQICSDNLSACLDKCGKPEFE